MPHHNTVFRQVTQRLPWAVIDKLVATSGADKGVRHLTTRDLLLTLLFAQLSDTRSLRGIEEILQTQQNRRYHSGLPPIHRSTLADAAAKRPLAVFTGVLATLIPQVARTLRRDIGACIRLIDSTTVPLSGLSGWSRFSAGLCGVKAHVVYDPDAGCPLYVGVTPAKVNDITAAKAMPIEAGATYVFDLGYYDYGWWARLDAKACRIVTRLRRNTPLRLARSQAVPPGQDHILSDRTGFLPERLSTTRRNPMAETAVREITVRIDTGRVIRLVTNDLDAPAEEIAGLYKRRWAIELFFRWIKQMLKLRHFLGRSENAVRIQIAVAMIAFVLIKLAHAAEGAIESLTSFARLVQATVLHRKRLDRLGRRDPHSEVPPVWNTAQGQLL